MSENNRALQAANRPPRKMRLTGRGECVLFASVLGVYGALATAIIVNGWRFL